ncbi:MAG: thioredoxin family protein [Actinobacteria bacterium]|nr:thioredoxin family protein [Actinomycetota bacterium]
MTGGLVDLSPDTFDGFVGSGPAVLLDFWAEWCHPCLAYEPVVEELVTLNSARLVAGRVDIAAYPELAERCQVRSIPALVLFQDGSITRRFFGVRVLRQLRDELDRLLAPGVDAP